jgi:proline iminopeptidase
MLLEARHLGRVGGLILQSTMARFDLDRLVAGFRRFAGDEVAALVRRDYSGDAVNESEWARVFAAFGPVVPNADELARRIRNPNVGSTGMERLRRLDIVTQLKRITCPTLVCVGALDPVTPLAASEEIVAALPAGLAHLEVIEGAGHFPWLDRPDVYWPALRSFVRNSVPLKRMSGGGRGP